MKLSILYIQLLNGEMDRLMLDCECLMPNERELLTDVIDEVISAFLVKFNLSVDKTRETISFINQEVRLS